jgi:hypothetical protein
MTTISKTTITFTVLHRTDEPFDSDYPLEEAMARSMDGHAVGGETGTITEEVPDDQVADELGELGNDGSFFDSDLGIEDEDEVAYQLIPVGETALGDAAYVVGPANDIGAQLNERLDALGDATKALKTEQTCDRHGGVWGDDETCARCTFEDGTPRPIDEPGPLTNEEEN